MAELASEKADAGLAMMFISAGVGARYDKPRRRDQRRRVQRPLDSPGRFTGEGFHVLKIEDLTFVGAVTWTAENGDTLDVEFTGQLFPSGDPVYPYGFIADLVVVGGTGRLAHAEGEAVMTGGFDGQQPGEFYFDVEGTLHPRGK